MLTPFFIGGNLEYHYDIYLLSQKFVDDHPLSKYPELMYKLGRPYNCLLIDHNDYYICIPYRSNIKHKNAFMFKGTERSKKTRSGLDYQKVVLINDKKYLDSRKAIIDPDEFVETIKYMPKIAKAVKVYIDMYIAHVTGAKILHPKEYERNYRFSTLPYFHDILDISEPVTDNKKSHISHL